MECDNADSRYKASWRSTSSSECQAIDKRATRDRGRRSCVLTYVNVPRDNGYSATISRVIVNSHRKVSCRIYADLGGIRERTFEPIYCLWRIRLRSHINRRNFWFLALKKKKIDIPNIFYAFHQRVKIYACWSKSCIKSMQCFLNEQHISWWQKSLKFPKNLFFFLTKKV